MGLFDGKKGLVFGVANKNSIAWGIAQALHAEGAELGFSYAGEFSRSASSRWPPASAADSSKSATSPTTTPSTLPLRRGKAHFGIDFMVHSIAFAPSEELGGRFVNTSRNGFRIALDISCYSLVALAATLAS
jgi:enoyl-[acyl-carrier protein] reductase I